MSHLPANAADVAQGFVEGIHTVLSFALQSNLIGGACQLCRKTVFVGSVRGVLGV
jgi:hypothetical protein